MRGSAAYAAALAAIVLVQACTGHFLDQDAATLERIKSEYGEFPGEFDALVGLSRSLYNEAGPPEEVARSLLAACKAVVLDPACPEANHLASTACTWLVEFGEKPYCYDEEAQQYYICDCVKHGENAVAGDIENAHYRYQLAMDLALRIRDSSFAAARFKLSTLVEVLQAAIEMDETLDQGGPLRLLGTIYLKAPPWPAGFGDEEMALELLEDAVTGHPGHPLNHLFYSEALMENEEYEKAWMHLATCRELMVPDKYFWRVEEWGRMADQLEKKLKKYSPGGSPGPPDREGEVPH